MFLFKKILAMKDGLSIIVVNYFSEGYVVSLVDRIISTIQIKEYEIIVVSNSPSDFKWKDDYCHNNNIRLIECGANDGFGRGINKGVENSRYNYFCMVNPDMGVDSNALDELYSFFTTQESDIGAISCLIEYSNGVKQCNYFMNNSLSKKDFILYLFRDVLPKSIRQFFSRDDLEPRADDGSSATPFEVGGFYCAFVMMRRSAFLDVRGFDPDFFMYAEDIDLFRNRFVNKYRCIFYPSVKLTHFVGKTDKHGLMALQAKVSYLLYLRKSGVFFLLAYVLFRSLRCSMVLTVSSFKKRDDVNEAYDFFKSLRYLFDILKYPADYGSRPSCLKILEIPD